MTVASIKYSNRLASDILRINKIIFTIISNLKKIKLAEVACFIDAGFPHEGIKINLHKKDVYMEFHSVLKED